MRQQWVPKSTENKSPNNDEQVTQELGDSTISTWFLKGKLELGYKRKTSKSVPFERTKSIQINIQDTKGSPSKKGTGYYRVTFYTEQGRVTDSIEQGQE